MQAPLPPGSPRTYAVSATRPSLTLIADGCVRMPRTTSDVSTSYTFTPPLLVTDCQTIILRGSSMSGSTIGRPMSSSTGRTCTSDADATGAVMVVPPLGTCATGDPS